MPTFIDESGNTGVYGKGGSARFHLAAVWIPSHGVANEFREGVGKLRGLLELKDTYEFKFANTHTHPERRSAFFKLALTIPFRFAMSSIDKSDPTWNLGRSSVQHWACATELAAILRPTYLAAEEDQEGLLKDAIVVDDNGDHSFLGIIKQQFHALPSGRKPGASLIGKVKFRHSSPDEMLQLVDMVCGATAAFIDSGNGEWYELIAERNLQVLSRS